MAAKEITVASAIRNPASAVKRASQLTAMRMGRNSHRTGSGALRSKEEDSRGARPARWHCPLTPPKQIRPHPGERAAAL